MLRFLTTGFVAMGLLMAAGCDEAAYDDSDTFEVESTDDFGTAPAAPMEVQPLETDTQIIEEDATVAEPEENDVLLLDAEQPQQSTTGAAQPPAAAPTDAEAAEGDAVEEVPAATLPDQAPQDSQPQGEQPQSGEQPEADDQP